MRRRQLPLVITAVMLLTCVGITSAQVLDISLGIRETEFAGGPSGPIGADGGSSGGIEWVNLDGQTLTADGTWQQFTFTPSTDTLTGFAGGSADGILDGNWATLEHIRIKNTVDGFSSYDVWIDDIVNTDASGPTLLTGFEAPYVVGDEVVFQEPDFSGSTNSNLVPGGVSGVTDTMAFAGSQSYAVDVDFLADLDPFWLRLTSFATPNLPNPLLHVNEPGAAPPTVSFYMKAVPIPEPATGSMALVLLGLVGLARKRR